MTDSPRRRTTSPGRGAWGHRGWYDSKTPPPADHVSYNQDQVGLRFGWVEILTAERRYTRGWSDPMVLTRCTGCGNVQWTNYTSLKLGKSKGCWPCSRPRKIPRKLDRVLTQAKQRCTNPNDAAYARYGGRGITFDFDSVTEAGLWILENLGPCPEGHELDRVDNNRGYAPGNLRWATPAQNMANRRCTRLEEYRPEEWPYEENTVRRKLSEGFSREEIFQQAESAVTQRRKGWRRIQQRLTSMTSEMRGRDIGTPRKGS